MQIAIPSGVTVERIDFTTPAGDGYTIRQDPQGKVSLSGPDYLPPSIHGKILADDVTFPNITTAIAAAIALAERAAELRAEREAADANAADELRTIVHEHGKPGKE